MEIKIILNHEILTYFTNPAKKRLKIVAEKFIDEVIVESGRISKCWKDDEADLEITEDSVLNAVKTRRLVKHKSKTKKIAEIVDKVGLFILGNMCGNFKSFLFTKENTLNNINAVCILVVLGVTIWGILYEYCVEDN